MEKYNTLRKHHMYKPGDRIEDQTGRKWIVIEERDGGVAVKEPPKISRRKLLLGAAATPVALYAGAVGLMHTDTEIGKALRFADSIGRVESTGELISDAQQEFNADTAATLSAPETYIQKLKDLEGMVDSVTKEIKAINKDGIKVNSGMVYRKQKKLQAAIARFYNENFSTAFKAAGLYMKGVGKLNQGIAAVREEISQLSTKVGSLLGGNLGSYATQFINQQAAKNLQYQTGNVTIAGINIPAASIAKLALAAQSLCTSLVKLQNELEEMADPNIEISNNDWISAFNTSPREEFVDDSYTIADLYLEVELKKNKNYSKEKIKKVQKILVKYGYLIQIGSEDVVSGKYDQATKAAIKKVLAIFVNFRKYEELYEAALAQGVKKPVVARGQEVYDAQDMLALAGYMGIKDIDKVYGPGTYRAASMFYDDCDIYEEENGLND